jgi:hypothetical protein
MSVSLYNSARLSQDFDSAQDPLFEHFSKILKTFEKLDFFLNQISHGANGSDLSANWKATLEEQF